MSQNSLVRSLVARYKKSQENWYTTSDPLDFDELKETYREDTKQLRGYLAKCKYVGPIFRALAPALMSPKIEIYADRIGTRIKDVEDLIKLLESGFSLAKQLQTEFDDLIVALAKGKKLRHGLIEEVQDLRSARDFRTLMERSGELHTRLIKEDEESHILWTLEDYIGFDAGVYQKLEKASETLNPFFMYDLAGAKSLFGYWIYLNDPNHIAQLIDGAREELE